MRMFDPEIWRQVTGGAVGERVRRLTRVTPLVPAPALGRRTGADVWLKLENLQRTGSFKLRGAAARLAAIALASEAEPASQGGGGRVIAASAGNHGLGVALAAQEFGVEATVLVSAQTPEVKRAGIAALGARVEVVGANYDDAEAEARRRAAADPGLIFVSAFDDDHVIAGNGGLLAREILAQLPDVQAIVVPVGGGGLAGGVGVEVVPRGIKLLGASPEVNCAMRRSLDDGRAYTSYEGGPTLAEGLEGAVSERTFAMARDYFPDIALVSELAIRQAIVYAYRTLGILCEASAAPALAALLDDAGAVRGRRTVVVISGGNIEPHLLDQLLAGSAPVGV
ncbi:MAG TPA: pyridoxal-phosphate dependent enzyme [Polyangia bacterium]|nr:pyridoxal-phosphate dependent enzyme [Polyangia bacterium]